MVGLYILPISDRRTRWVWAIVLFQLRVAELRKRRLVMVGAEYTWTRV